MSVFPADAQTGSIDLNESIEVAEGQRQGDGVFYWATGRLSAEVIHPSGEPGFLIASVEASGSSFLQLEWNWSSSSESLLVRSVRGEEQFDVAVGEVDFENLLQEAVYKQPGSHPVSVSWTSSSPTIQLADFVLTEWAVEERLDGPSTLNMGVDVAADILTVDKAVPMTLKFFGNEDFADCPAIDAQILGGSAVLAPVECKKVDGTWIATSSLTATGEGRVHVNIIATAPDQSQERTAVAFSMVAETATSPLWTYGSRVLLAAVGCIMLWFANRLLRSHKTADNER